MLKNFVLPILLLNFNVIYSRLITSAWEERADFSAINYMCFVVSFGEVSSSSCCLR